MTPPLAHEVHGEGPALVLLHAFPFDRRLFEAALPGLGGLRVVLVDLPGFGASRDVVAVSLDEHARLVDETLASLGVERAAVLGVSMGGYVALALAERRPARVSAVFLVDSRAQADDDASRAGRATAIAKVRAEGPRALAEGQLGWLVAKGAPDAARARVLELAGAQAPDGVVRALEAMRDRPDRSAFLEQLPVPLHVVVGEEDTFTTAPELRELASRTPGATLDVLRGVGHLAPLEAPERFADLVRRRLAPRPTHLDARGDAHMVGVGHKHATERRAVAEATVTMRSETLLAISQGGLPKGDAFAVARVAGIMAGKRTPDWIPLCHPVALSKIELDFACDPGGTVTIRATAECTDKTGVEMEAMVAASAAALTLYDMAKSIDRWMTISSVRLLEKSGGKSGTLHRP